jgi:hypothetical protein
MKQVLPNGVIISDHHPYGRTWHQFIIEQADRDANIADTPDYALCSRTEALVPTTFRQWFAPFSPLNI